MLFPLLEVDFYGRTIPTSCMIADFTPRLTRSPNASQDPSLLRFMAYSFQEWVIQRSTGLMNEDCSAVYTQFKPRMPVRLTVFKRELSLEQGCYFRDNSVIDFTE